MISQSRSHLTGADLVVVVAAVIIGFLGEIVVVGQGDTAVITFVVTVDKPRYAHMLAHCLLRRASGTKHSRSQGNV